MAKAKRVHHPVALLSLMLQALLASAHGCLLVLCPAFMFASLEEQGGGGGTGAGLKFDGGTRAEELLLHVCRSLGLVELTLAALFALRIGKPKKHLSALKLGSFAAAALMLAALSRLLDDVDEPMRATETTALCLHTLRFVVAIAGVVAAPRELPTTSTSETPVESRKTQ